MSDATEWLFYKLYLGEHEDAFDFMIADGIGDAVRRFGEDRWFFLRYIDEGGIHLRLRFRVPAADARALDRQIYAVLDDALVHISQRPPATYEPLLTFRNIELPRPPQMPIQCVRETYAPELDVFGGPVGMEIAEELFHASSRIARLALIDEAAGALDRKDLLLPIMIEAMAAFIAARETGAFLDRYAAYWLAGSPDIGMLKSAFSDKAYDLIDEEVEIVRSAAGAAAAHIDAWRSAVRRAQQRYKKSCPLYSAALADSLCFQFTHLMNNRLGISIFEEAYLATLLDRAMESGAVHAPA